MFEALFSGAVVYGADVVHGGFMVHDFEKQEHYQPVEVVEMIKTNIFGGLVGEPAWFSASWPAIWSNLYRRKFLQESSISFWPEFSLGEDMAFQFEVFQKARRVSVVGRPLYHYHMGLGSQITGKRGRELFVQFPLFDRMFALAGELGTVGAERKFKERQIRSHLWALRIGELKIRSEYRIGAAKDIFEARKLLSLPEVFRILSKEFELVYGPAVALPLGLLRKVPQ